MLYLMNTISFFPAMVFNTRDLRFKQVSIDKNGRKVQTALNKWAIGDVLMWSAEITASNAINFDILNVRICCNNPNPYIVFNQMIIMRIIRRMLKNAIAKRSLSFSNIPNRGVKYGSAVSNGRPRFY